MEERSNYKQFVTFTMSQELYGVNIFNTQEIIRMPDITPVPNAQKFIEGIINLRGDVIPVINLESKFQIPSTGSQNEIIVIRSQGQKLGIMVEKVFRVFEVEESNIAPPPSILSNIDEEYILGVTRVENEKLIIFLDVEFMFFDEDIKSLQNLITK